VQNNRKLVPQKKSCGTVRTVVENRVDVVVARAGITLVVVAVVVVVVYSGIQH